MRPWHWNGRVARAALAAWCAACGAAVGQARASDEDAA